jgi:hypothetical protein
MGNGVLPYGLSYRAILDSTVRDVTPAATRAAAIKGAADIPARSPFMLRPRCRTLKALSCSDPMLRCGATTLTTFSDQPRQIFKLVF